MFSKLIQSLGIVFAGLVVVLFGLLSLYVSYLLGIGLLIITLVVIVYNAISMLSD